MTIQYVFPLLFPKSEEQQFSAVDYFRRVLSTPLEGIHICHYIGQGLHLCYYIGYYIGRGIHMCYYIGYYIA